MHFNTALLALFLTVSAVFSLPLAQGQAERRGGERSEHLGLKDRQNPLNGLQIEIDGAKFRIMNAATIAVAGAGPYAIAMSQNAAANIAGAAWSMWHNSDSSWYTDNSRGQIIGYSETWAANGDSQPMWGYMTPDELEIIYTQVLSYVVNHGLNGVEWLLQIWGASGSQGAQEWVDIAWFDGQAAT